MHALTLADIFSAKRRIAPFVNHTPIVESSLLNQWLGHRILFKAECLQKVGAFKARGACNAVVSRIEQGRKPAHIVASSSGNHAQAVAWAAHKFAIPATIYMPKTVSTVKLAATQHYGAHTVLCEDRFEADRRVSQHAQASHEVCWIPPYDHDDVICGQGTACLESVMAYPDIDAIAVPCGGGGLLSGSYIAAKGLNPAIELIGVEPFNASDAYQSRRSGAVIKLEQSPQTLADGAATLSVSERTLHYLMQVEHFVLASERQIAYWTQWLQHLLKLQIEPTCAMTMVGVVDWLKQQTAIAPAAKKTVCVIISGGNIDNSKRQLLHAVDYLDRIPGLDLLV
jgi:threo-3-hydroxy-L-aspartate ammonia-lyase